MSLYNDNGNEMPRMNSTMMALLSVSSQRKWVFSRPGNKEAMTCGMVSPTIMQKATMPPNAKAHCAIDMATSPDLP